MERLEQQVRRLRHHQAAEKPDSAAVATVILSTLAKRPVIEAVSAHRDCDRPRAPNRTKRSRMCARWRQEVRHRRAHVRACAPSAPAPRVPWRWSLDMPPAIRRDTRPIGALSAAGRCRSIRRSALAAANADAGTPLAGPRHAWQAPDVAGPVTDAVCRVEQLAAMAHQPVVVQRVERRNPSLRKRPRDRRRQTREVMDMSDVRPAVVDQLARDGADRLVPIGVLEAARRSKRVVDANHAEAVLRLLANGVFRPRRIRFAREDDDLVAAVAQCAARASTRRSPPRPARTEGSRGRFRGLSYAPPSPQPPPPRAGQSAEVLAERPGECERRGPAHFPEALAVGRPASQAAQVKSHRRHDGASEAGEGREWS